jgi:hypothetical protein
MLPLPSIQLNTIASRNQSQLVLRRARAPLDYLLSYLLALSLPSLLTADYLLALPFIQLAAIASRRHAKALRHVSPAPALLQDFNFYIYMIP